MEKLKYLISSESNPDLIIFNWNDPQEAPPGWEDFENSFIDLADCLSVGWLIGENKKCYVLAADLIINNGKITDTGRRQSIYKSKLNILWRVKFNIYAKKMETTKNHKSKFKP